MDVINMISKAPGLPDAPPVTGERYEFGGRYFIHGPRLEEFLQEMKREVLSAYDVITVGETPLMTTSQAAAITDEASGALNMVFQFEHMDLDVQPGRSKWYPKPVELEALKRVMSRWQTELADGWNSLYLSNHDQPRAVSRFGDDGRYRVESAKMLATFLHMQQGTPYIYQGEEIGMTNVRFPSIEDYRDIESLNMYREYAGQRGMAPQQVMKMIHVKSRDNARTPMQWDDSPHAGFTTGRPWIQVNPNYATVNVAQARGDPNSIFATYQQLIRLRKKHPVIVYGAYELIPDTGEAIYAFTRTLDNELLLVILNFSADTAVFRQPATLDMEHAELLIGNYPVDPGETPSELALRPYEARVYLAG
jgi:oligo-1,6-glucosidase